MPEIDTNIIEIKKLFGLIILMGIIYKPNVLKHWSYIIHLLFKSYNM